MTDHLRPCVSCRRHVRVSGVVCPFCGVVLDDGFRGVAPRPMPGKRLNRAATYAFGAALATAVPACGPTAAPPPPPENIVQPYGAPPDPPPPPLPPPPPTPPDNIVQPYGAPPDPPRPPTPPTPPAHSGTGHTKQHAPRDPGQMIAAYGVAPDPSSPGLE